MCATERQMEWNGEYRANVAQSQMKPFRAQGDALPERRHPHRTAGIDDSLSIG